MDDMRLKKLGAELEKARAKQAAWTEKVKDLERKYREAENTCISEMVHAAHLTPEKLAVIIHRAKAGEFGPVEAWPEDTETQEEVFIDE